MKITRTLLATVAAAGMVGCANTPLIHHESPESDPALARLAIAAENVQRYSNDLAAIESAKYQKEGGQIATAPKIEYLPTMEQLVSLGDEWHGPVEPLVRELATLSGFTTRTLGVEPPGGVNVTVDTRYRRIIDILVDAGYQSGKRAALRVLAKERVIEVEYAKF